MSKIIVYDIEGELEVLVFSNALTHVNVANYCSSKIPLYAGTVGIELYDNWSISITGESLTLGVNMPRDPVIKDAIRAKIIKCFNGDTGRIDVINYNNDIIMVSDKNILREGLDLSVIDWLTRQDSDNDTYITSTDKVSSKKLFNMLCMV